MAGNNDQAQRGNAARRSYLLSGLLRWGKCGQVLQGKSARAPNGKTYLYYAHKGKCPEDGHDRVDAGAVDTLVIDRLTDLVSGGKHAERLEAEGTLRLSRRINVLQKASQGIQTEHKQLEEETEDRIRELTRTSDERVRQSIRKSLLTLQTRTEQDNENQLYLDRTLTELKALSSPKTSLLSRYTPEIRSILDAPTGARKPGLQRLFASLVLDETHIITVLAGV